MWRGALLVCVLNGGVVKFLGVVRRNIVNVPHLVAFFNIPLLLCFLLGTFGQRGPNFWPHRFRSRGDLCFGQSTIHPRITREWRCLFRMRKVVDPTATSKYFKKIENDDSFGTNISPLGMTWCDIPHTYFRNLLLLPWRRDQLQRSLQLRLLLAKSHPLRSTLFSMPCQSAMVWFSDW